MRRLANNRRGFSIIESILIVVVVGVIGVGGWLVYNHDKTKVSDAAAANGASASKTQSGTQSSSTSATSTQASTLAITQWGVHLTLNSTTASMNYYINPNDPNVAYVSLAAISDIAPKCAADEYALGAISRLTEAEQDSATASPSALDQPGTIHIGNYWYNVSTSKAACTDSSAEETAISQALPDYNPSVLLQTLDTLAAN